MVCRTVRNFVRQNCPLAAINTNYIVIKLAMKTPKAILVPAGFVGDALQDGLNMCPMLGAVDVTSMPVVGPFVAGVRAAQAAEAVVRTLGRTAAPLESVGTGTEAPVEGIHAAMVRTARDKAEDEELHAPKGRSNPRTRKKHSMPLPDWF